MRRPSPRLPRQVPLLSTQRRPVSGTLDHDPAALGEASASSKVMIRCSGSHAAPASLERNSLATSVRIGVAVIASRKPSTISVGESPSSGDLGV